MAERGRNRLLPIVLPGSCFEGNNAPTLLDDRHVSVTVQCAARPQIIDRQSNRLRGRSGAEVTGDADDRGRFQEGTGHAAMNCGQEWTADDLWREWHHPC